MSEVRFPRQQAGVGGDDQHRDARCRRLRVQLLQEFPSHLLPHDDIDDQGIRVQRGDLGEGVGHEVGGGDVVALILEQLPRKSGDPLMAKMCLRCSWLRSSTTPPSSQLVSNGREA